MDRLSQVVVALLYRWHPVAALAEQPRVHFDMPYAVACRDVTPADYAGARIRGTSSSKRSSRSRRC